jgi:hypothetical protein
VTKPVTHKLGPTWALHAAEVLQQIRMKEIEVQGLKGKILDAQQEIDFMRRHMSVLIGQIEKAEHLPPSVRPYALSEDGSAMIGEIEAQENA